ncbi:hypothetical protein HMPREF9456_00723 [Dysgonomonas mossii DSM 22836]|uniref:Uncharacterized protein n=1 Tax=Dysgonomonas mossii DSM 22836 TaxID=742767 RepID=F8WY32_9BACT|nr:hypothetical protein HMPREF9456_00723 [Dysgonomonas mossii DSM 22836]
MMTMMVILYIINWISMTYSYLTAPSDVKLWSEEID